jgi:hypothetical protein
MPEKNLQEILGASFYVPFDSRFLESFPSIRDAVLDNRTSWDFRIRILEQRADVTASPTGRCPKPARATESLSARAEVVLEAAHALQARPRLSATDRRG